MACDAQTLINAAYANGYAKLSERDLLMTVAASACAGGGGGGGSQIVAYTGANPNADAVVPPDQTKAAIAVKPNSAIYTWNTDTLTWA